MANKRRLEHFIILFSFTALLNVNSDIDKYKYEDILYNKYTILDNLWRSIISEMGSDSISYSHLLILHEQPILYISLHIY